MISACQDVSGVFPGEDSAGKVRVAVTRKARSKYEWCAGSREKKGPESLRKLPDLFLWVSGELKRRDAGDIKKSCNGWIESRPIGVWVKGFIRSIIMNRLSSSRVRIHSVVIIWS